VRVKKINATSMTVAEGAHMLSISLRQMKRIKKRYRKQGPMGLLHQRRGKLGNRRYESSLKNHVLTLLQCQYEGFGPTLAAEMLKEIDGIPISRETLRQWMRQDSIRYKKRRQRKKPHQSRSRRACFGELIQVDGSPHAWFEDRGPECGLIVFIDDATSALVALHFVEHESLSAYVKTLRGYIERQGCPMALCSDKHSVFHIGAKEAVSGTGETQYGRMLKELGIELICAHTPQAKGRVARVNRSLQDRLVKDAACKYQ